MIPVFDRPRPAYTFVELLVTVAALVIVLGLMVRLAGHVRAESAHALTKSLLRQLDLGMVDFARLHGGAVPQVAMFPPPEAVAEAVAARAASRATPSPAVRLPSDDAPNVDRRLQLRWASANNRDLLLAFRAEPAVSAKVLSDLPVSVYDEAQIRDAWGSPIVFMPNSHPWVGTAPRDKAYFFVSAGPDRDYLTLGDNLYSYEELAGGAGR